MTQWYYLAGLLVAISCMAIIDYRFKLAFWHARRRTVATILTAVIVFVVWDICGITNRVFFTGDSHFFLPYRIFSQFPVEELFFLTLLCYCTLVLYQIGAKRWPRI